MPFDTLGRRISCNSVLSRSTPWARRLYRYGARKWSQRCWRDQASLSAVRKSAAPSGAIVGLYWSGPHGPIAFSWPTTSKLWPASPGSSSVWAIQCREWLSWAEVYASGRQSKVAHLPL